MNTPTDLREGDNWAFSTQKGWHCLRCGAKHVPLEQQLNHRCSVGGTFDLGIEWIEATPLGLCVGFRCGCLSWTHDDLGHPWTVRCCSPEHNVNYYDCYE